MRRSLLHVTLLYGLLSVGLAWSLAPFWQQPTLDLEASYGPSTNILSLAAAGFNLWLLSGLLLAWAWRQRTISAEIWLQVGTITLLTLFVLNVSREHVVFGDVFDYTTAAQNLRRGEPLHPRYVYPPFWAALLAQAYRLLNSWELVLWLCFVLNQLSLALFFLLAFPFFKRLGVSTRQTALLLTLHSVANVPLLRNLVYVQVNYWLLVTIMGALLLRKRWPLLSGVVLAIGVHLKLIPLIIAPLLLIEEKRWRWSIGALLGGGLLLAITLWLYGPEPYRQFVTNLNAWQPTQLRSASLFGWLTNVNERTGLALPAQALSALYTLAATAWLGYLSWRLWQQSPANSRYHAALPLCFIVVTASPTIWVHHLAFLSLPAIWLLFRLDGTRQWSLYAIAYALLFWLPVFDWWPWSYLRVVGWVLLLALLSLVVLRQQSARPLPLLERL